MTIPTAATPAPPPDLDQLGSDAPPVRPAARGLVAATAIIATVGVVVALLGLGLMLRTVTTPTQDCGTAAAFLLDGRVNVFVSETDPPKGITPAEAKANNAKPCRVRVADQTKPAAVLFGAGMVAAIGAALTELAVRIRDGLKRRKAPPSPATTPGPSAPEPFVPPTG